MQRLKSVFKQVNLRKKLHLAAFWLSILTLLALVFDLGFKHTAVETGFLLRLYLVTLAVGIVSEVIRFIGKKERPKGKVFIFDLLSVLYLSLLLFAQFGFVDALSFLGFYINSSWVYVALVLIFIREFSALKINLRETGISPAQLFVLSFLSLILIGTLLLMLPNSTYDGITFLDALFTATSAVCVTGLIVVDTATYFTPLGQTIIMVLIQTGGLGIMTFASYFSYFFSGGSSYENQLYLQDLTSSEKLGEVFGTIKRIIFVTFTIEAIGAFLIFQTLDKNVIPDFYKRVYFAVFHAISAFCNAGFSTLTNNLFEEGFRFNYPLQIVIIALFVIGGIGFPIVFNLFRYLKYQALRLVSPKPAHRPWVVNINTRIVLITTAFLVIFGSVLFFVFEYNRTLSEHGFWGKIVTAIFGGTTPRTAGFNTVDMTAVSFPTIMIIFLLMWIGASPASTGGGIKTSTFAIAILNAVSLAKGKDRTEIYRREISNNSVERAFAIMFLSLLAIGVSVFLISAFDSDKQLLGIAFECFSAFSTVGLSIGITNSLSDPSKFVIILLMFVGRVGTLTLLIAVMKKEIYKSYKYPTEEILIN
jgi:potassium uptake TrkH family protein